MFERCALVFYFVTGSRKSAKHDCVASLYCIYVYSTKKENPHSKYCVCFHQSYFMIRFPVTGEKKFLSGHAKLKYISCV